MRRIYVLMNSIKEVDSVWETPEGAFKEVNERVAKNSLWTFMNGSNGPTWFAWSRPSDAAADQVSDPIFTIIVRTIQP